MIRPIPATVSLAGLGAEPAGAYRYAYSNILISADEHVQTGCRTWLPPLSRPPGPRRRRSSTPGCSSWTRSHPPPASVLPESAARNVSAFGVASSHSGHPARHQAPNQEPGRILIPGDGAAGDQGLRMGLSAGDGGYATPAAGPVSTTSWHYGLRRTRRLVTGGSHRPRSTWPDQARLAFLAVTHRYKRTNCLWLERFQLSLPTLRGCLRSGTDISSSTDLPVLPPGVWKTRRSGCPLSRALPLRPRCPGRHGHPWLDADR